MIISSSAGILLLTAALFSGALLAASFLGSIPMARRLLSMDQTQILSLNDKHSNKISVGSVPVSILPNCKDLPSLKAGSSCRLTIAEASPTQFAFGKLAAMCKQQTLEAFDTKEDLDSFLQDPDNVVPMLVRGDRFFILDHHHGLRALHDANLKKKVSDKAPLQREFVVNVIDNWTGKAFPSEADFWAVMESKNYAWLLDSNGVTIPPQQVDKLMPKVVSDLQNDPFRTMSYALRRYGGYGKSGAYFSEFKWATWLRNFFYYTKDHMSSVESEKARLKELFKIGMKLAESKQSRNLPGWNDGKPNVPKCPVLQNMD